jgi:hypothetical protein
MIEVGSEAMTFSRLRSKDAKVDQLWRAAVSDMSNWKSCKEGAVELRQRRIDFTLSMNDWAGRGRVGSSVKRGGPNGALLDTGC